MNPLTWLLDLIYPPKCVVCHKLLESSRAPVCQHCMDNLPEHDGADPHVRFADRCVATCFYEEPLRTSIHRFKFGGCRQYAAVYGKWMAVTIGDKLAGKFDLITWAPVSRERRKKRGYDQAELLCKAVSRALDVPMARTLTKETDNPALAPYFAWKGGIECIRHKDVGDEMFGAELENEVADFFAKLTPLYTYFTRFGV